MPRRLFVPALPGRSLLLLLALAALLPAAPLPAQESPPAESPVIKVDVEIVSVTVTVRDRKGRLVTGLAREDFTLEEDGRKQDIEYFARQTDLPLTVGLVIDTTPSETDMLEKEREVCRVFLRDQLRPEKDRAFVIQYAAEVELLQDLTSSVGRLERALGRLEPHGFGGAPGGPGGPGGRGGGSPYETALADAVFLSADEITRFEKGRKAVIVIGDGDHVGERLDMAVSANQRADTLVYAIRVYDKDFGGGGGWKDILRRPPLGGPGGAGGPGGEPGGPGGGPGGPRPGRGGKKNLQEICRRTGGAYYEISEKKTLEQIFAEIAEELRSQYSLGYAPAADARDGFRKVRVEVKPKGLVVQCRDGYQPRK